MRNRAGLAWAALLGNGMAWFGAAGFVLGLAGEQADALTTGPWPRVVGFVLVVVVGLALIGAGVWDNHRIRTGHRRAS